MKNISVNGKVLLEPYVSSGGVKSTGESTGFARVKQKSSLIGLKALASSVIRDRAGVEDISVDPGDMVYFKEEDLHSHAWAKTLFDSDALDKKFIVAEAAFVVMVRKSQ